MARLARIAVPALPYHVTQRGNRRQPVFFRADDFRMYLTLLQEESRRWQSRVWAYCSMTNHVHLIVWPTAEQSLARGIGETHRRYTRYINAREGWSGYLWQGRFGSVPLDEGHLLAAMRYVECNPVKARVVAQAADYPWSSARAHVLNRPDPILSSCFLTDQILDWKNFLATPEESTRVHQVEVQVRTGRPYGTPAFVERLEHTVGYRLQRLPAGRKSK